jgi:outer membrane protein assembly factor BamB
MPMYSRISLNLASLLPLFLIACGGGGSGGSGAAPVAAAPSITAQPANQAVIIGRPATFTVTAAGTAPLTFQWQKGGAPISGATASSYTTPATAQTDDGSTFLVVVSNAVGSMTSAGAKLKVVTGTAKSRGTDVTTYKNDLSRSGQNLSESALNLTTVTASTFGLLRTLPVDGKVDAQPLYLSALSAAGGSFNTVFVATEHDSVYAFDSDSGAVLWHVSLLGTGETTSDSRGCSQVVPEIGVTSTPVIDRTAGAHGTLYVVAMSIDAQSNYHQRLHALDITTGAELLNGPVDISAAFPAGGTATSSFDPKAYEERAALLLSNGTIYTSWTSHCDHTPYGGWIIAYT